MKKIIYSFSAFTLFAAAGLAQSATPNGGFEAWTIMNAELPQGYIVSSNSEAFYKCGCPANETKTTDFYHGSYAVHLQTQIGNGDTNVAYFINTNPNGNPNQWAGGIAYSQQPTGIRGYYKSAVPAGDSALILVNFKKSGASIGFFAFPLYGTHSSYTLFNFPINIPFAPDTIQFGATSSDFKDNIFMAGSMLQIDSISFTGVSSQPTNFNGDFENWVPEVYSTPTSWYITGGGSNGNPGVYQTTDKNAGTYAVELQTFLGDNNGNPVARGGGVSTGYYPHGNCMGTNCLKGGLPFTNQQDTLEFYYKYAPVNGDSAEVDINFKHLGNVVSNAGTRIPTAASTYQHMKIPFNTMTTIDSVVVSFYSSSFNDTSLAFIGSDFKVDDVYFTSQSTGIEKFDASALMQVYPNPAVEGNFVVSNIGRHDLVRVLNVYGQEVNAEIVKENGTAKIHVSTPGAYMVYVNARGKVTMQKVIVGK